MTAATPLTRPYQQHYTDGFDRLIRGMTALTDVWELIPPFDQGQLLDLLLPGIRDQRGCWDELADPLDRLTRLDARTALDVMRNLGSHGPLNPDTAYDQARAAIEAEISDVIGLHLSIARHPAGSRRPGGAS